MFCLHFSKSKHGWKEAHRKAWQLEHFSMSLPTLIQPYLAHIRGDSMRGLPVHFEQWNTKEKYTCTSILLKNTRIYMSLTKVFSTWGAFNWWLQSEKQYGWFVVGCNLKRILNMIPLLNKKLLCSLPHKVCYFLRQELLTLLVHWKKKIKRKIKIYKSI